MAVKVVQVPTQWWPRIIYDTTTPKTLDAPLPLAQVSWPRGFLRVDNVAPSAEESLFRRTDLAAQLGFQHLRSDFVFTLAKFLEDWAAKGKTFELLIDRFSGSFFEFDDDLRDQNGDAATFTNPTYVAATYGKAVSLGAADGAFTIPVAPAANNPRILKDEGMLLCIVKPGFAGNDGALHVLLDCAVAATQNRLLLQKSAANELEFTIYDNTIGSVKTVKAAVSWAVDAEQAIVAIWRTNGAMELWLNEVKATGTAGAGTGILNSLASTIYLHTDFTTANYAAGKYDRLLLLKKGYVVNAQVLKALKEFFWWGRNYFSRAKVLDLSFNPTKQATGLDLYALTLTVRQSS
jgi:hypothetical protein